MSVLQSEISSMRESGATDIEIDTKLNESGYLAGLENMLNNLGLGAKEAQDLLKLWGFDATVTEIAPKVKTTAVTETYYQPAQYHTEELPVGNGNGTYKELVMDRPARFIPVHGKKTSVTPGGGALKISGLHESFGGNVKFNESSNGGGTSGTSSGNTGGSGGRSSGGSSKSPSPDTSKKDTKNPAKDTRDIYHDINIELKQIEREIDRVQEKQDRLYGKELLDNLNKQQELLEKHKDTLAEKQKLQEWDLQNQRETLENLDVTFDSYGNISNYMDILGQKQAAVNAKTKEYNDLVSQYNALTDKDAKK